MALFSIKYLIFNAAENRIQFLDDDAWDQWKGSRKIVGEDKNSRDFAFQAH